MGDSSSSAVAGTEDLAVSVVDLGLRVEARFLVTLATVLAGSASLAASCAGDLVSSIFRPRNGIAAIVSGSTFNFCSMSPLSLFAPSVL